MGQAYNDFGNILFDQGNYVQSEQKYLKSLEIRKAVSDKKGMAETYNNLGITYIEQGNYSRAAEMMEKSIEIMQSIGYTIGIAGTGLNLGCIYQDQGRFDDAFSMHKQSYIISQKINNKPVTALSLSNLGLVCIEQEKYTEAVEYLQKSLDLMEELDFRNNEPQTQVWLSQALLSLQEKDRSIKIAREAIENAKRLQQKANLGIAKRWWAALEIRLADDNTARHKTKNSQIESLLNESIKIFEDLNMEHEKGRTCLELVRYYRWIDDRLQLQENFKKAQLIFKKLGALGDLKKLEQAII
jgi:tetratricopeptide (TPR) repeat protein